MDEVAHPGLTGWQGRLEALRCAALAGGDAAAQAHLGDAAACAEHYGTPRADGRSGCRRAVMPLGGMFSTPRSRAVRARGEIDVGVRVGKWRRRRSKNYAREALIARQQIKSAERRLRELAAGNKVLEAQGNAVGIATACVLWTCVGDPRKYRAAAGYRKAMGLNLKERSSRDY